MTQSHVTPETLVEYIHAQLPAHDDASVHQHIADCAPCREAYEAEVRLTEMLRMHARSEEREMPPALAHDIRAAIARRPRVDLLGLTWLRPVLIAAAIVAGILAGSYASIGGLHSRARASSIDASYYIDDHAALEDPTTPLGLDPALPVALTTGDTHGDEGPVAP